MVWALDLTPKRDANGKAILPGLEESLFEGLLVYAFIDIIPRQCGPYSRYKQATHTFC